MSRSETYLVLYPDGSYRNLVCDRSQLCYEFQDAIGCDCFEIVHSQYGFLMAVDESGAVSGSQLVNMFASALYVGGAVGPYIYGPVIFCFDGIVDGEPDIVPVPAPILDAIKDWIEDCKKLI